MKDTGRMPSGSFLLHGTLFFLGSLALGAGAIFLPSGPESSETTLGHVFAVYTCAALGLLGTVSMLIGLCFTRKSIEGSRVSSYVWSLGAGASTFGSARLFAGWIPGNPVVPLLVTVALPMAFCLVSAQGRAFLRRRAGVVSS